MATLVQFLAAGVNGAASGSATFVLRGTSSSALSVMYSDFEGTTQPDSNVVTLDSNGAAEIYVDAYVDVQIRNSAGTLMRTVTVGNSAPLVEVQSSSFTGTDYDNSPANTAGEPITLKALLDKWVTSAGAVDWKVLFGGSATNLQTALAGLAGMFFNVKDPTYGAVGNGVTDDTTAIIAASAAVLAAGGGILFFPPGTYQVSSLSLSAVDIVLMGCGEEASIIRSNAEATSILAFTDNTAASSKRITGLGFVATAGHDVLIDVEESQQLTIDNCKFDGTNVSDACIRRLDVDGETNLTITNCTFVDVEGDSAIQNLSDDGESFITLDSCRFVLASDFVGACIDGPDFSVSQCKFDGSAITTAVEYHHINASSNETVGKYLGSFIGNKFYDGGSDGFAFKLDAIAEGSVFAEANNEFNGFTEPADITDSGHIYDVSSVNSASLLDCQVRLGSRAGKVLRFSHEDQLAILDTLFPLVVAETVLITLADGFSNGFESGNFNFTLPASRMPPGSMFKVMVHNDSGGSLGVNLATGLSTQEFPLTVVDGGKGYFIGEVAIQSTGSEFIAVYGTENAAS
jgi:hypothetical protein